MTIAYLPTPENWFEEFSLTLNDKQCTITYQHDDRIDGWFFQLVLNDDILIYPRLLRILPDSINKKFTHTELDGYFKVITNSDNEEPNLTNFGNSVYLGYVT